MIGSSPRVLTYQVGSSILHRLDPRLKLLASIGVIGGALVAGSPLTISIAIILAALPSCFAPVLLPPLWRALRPLLILIALFGVLITVVTPGHALAHLWILVPTRDGVFLAIRLGIQALLIVFTTSLLTLTTPPLAIADAMEWALAPLARIGIPVRDVVAMISIGLTFVPLLIEEVQRVMAAQRARGASLGINALLEEEAMGALLIPLLLANLRRGYDLAESMEARLYATGPRTAMQERHFTRPDLLAGAVVAAIVSIIAVFSFVWQPF